MSWTKIWYQEVPPWVAKSHCECQPELESKDICSPVLKPTWVEFCRSSISTHHPQILISCSVLWVSQLILQPKKIKNMAKELGLWAAPRQGCWPSAWTMKQLQLTLVGWIPRSWGETPVALFFWRFPSLHFLHLLLHIDSWALFRHILTIKPSKNQDESRYNPIHQPHWTSSLLKSSRSPRQSLCALVLGIGCLCAKCVQPS